jgi:acetylornithine deacetylase/succinyl-diaminopimelate desuccinylase-like protein
MDDATTAAHTSTEERVRQILPELLADLRELIAIPSVSAPGYPEATHAALRQAQEKVTHMLEQAGFEHIEAIELPDTAPVVFAEIPAPPGAPTVLLYSHYDVVPVGDESLWNTPPFEPTERDGAIYGRGSADTKSNIVALIGAVRAWGGRPPVGVKVVIEGMEEVGGGAFTTYPPTDPERFAADVMIIGDLGNVRPGVPTLTVGLRGMANVVVEVRTLASAKHSGQYGGAAPDALLALLRALASLHDDDGNVAVAGLRRNEWTGGGPDEAEFRELAEALDTAPLIGTGTLGSRVWSGPAITVIGIDVPSVEGSLNAVSPYARAKLNVRVHPEQDPREAQAAVAAHLRDAMPFGIELTVHEEATGSGFAARTSSPAYTAAREAWTQAWGTDTMLAGAGGSIPLVSSLAQAAPNADILLVGATDGYSNIHGPNERVLIDEFVRTTIAEADLLGRLAGISASEAGS